MIGIEQFLAFTAPYECLSCGNEGLLVCDLCAPMVFDDMPSRCYRCHALTQDSRTCQKCRRTSALSHVWVATEYDNVAKQLVRSLKFERAKDAHIPIARRMRGTLPYLDSSLLVTSIPTASTRVRARGYDQSRLLAKYLAKYLRVPYGDVLVRHGQTRQVRATRQQRFAQSEGMFTVKHADRVAGKHILIVDDILTTGASLEAAARLLKIAGASQIDACVFAQKQ